MNKIRQQSANNQNGFTILELLIATAVFSIVLLLCATAVLQVGQLFYKGVITNRIQDTARKVVNDVIGSIQYGESGLTYTRLSSPGRTTVCLGSIRYTFLDGVSVGGAPLQVPHVLWKDRLGAGAACGSLPVNMVTPASGEELLGSNMRIKDFNVVQLSGSAWQVMVTVAYGATDNVFAVSGGVPDYGHCVNRKLGGQFCAVSSVTSYATERL